MLMFYFSLLRATHSCPFFLSMFCRECRKELDDRYHDLCRGHAYCARGPQYFGESCVVCEELWERSGNLDDPEDAMAMFKILKRWVAGFRKNSRHRTEGMSHFYSAKERDAFQELVVIHANLEAIQESDKAAHTARVSVTYL